MIPLGDSQQYFDVGPTATLTVELGLLPQPLLFLSADLGYALSPFQAQESLSTLVASAGAGAYLDLSARLSVKASASGGYYFSFFNTAGEQTTGGNPFLDAGLGISFVLMPEMSIGASLSYRNYFGLNQGIAASVSGSYILDGQKSRRAKIEKEQALRVNRQEAKTPKSGEGIALSKVELGRIFPVFYGYYDDHPIGRIVLHNQDTRPVTDIRVSFFVKQFMDAPKECLALKELGKGESRDGNLFALFKDGVLSITEGTKVAAEIALEYMMGGEKYRDVRVETVEMLDRNAMTWDDNRKAAAFVTAKDPAVMSFSKNVMGLLGEKQGSQINENLRKAMAIHEALSVYGLSYVKDPKTPFEEYSKNRDMADYLQFPRHTLAFKAGDCDDLTLLYCALLESVAVDTAFITVPGHIYAAFCLGISPEEAKRAFSRQEDLVFKEGKVWVPLEVTERDGDFLKVWQTGAKEWRENVLADQAGFFPVAAAWALYKPVGLPEPATEVALPPKEKLAAAYGAQIARFIDREISPQVAALKEQIRTSNGSPKARNKLGALYARYGLLDKAETEFAAAASQAGYPPALLNLGNIYFLREDWRKALELFTRAAALAPTDPTAQLGLARAYHQLEKFAMAKACFQKVKQSSPELARKYSYLEGAAADSARAADVSLMKEVSQWAEE